jgi:hypothetical protein
MLQLFKGIDSSTIATQPRPPGLARHETDELAVPRPNYPIPLESRSARILIRSTGCLSGSADSTPMVIDSSGGISGTDVMDDDSIGEEDGDMDGEVEPAAEGEEEEEEEEEETMMEVEMENDDLEEIGQVKEDGKKAKSRCACPPKLSTYLDSMGQHPASGNPGRHQLFLAYSQNEIDKFCHR